MKLSAVLLLAARTEGSHFRAANYEIIQAANGNVQLSRTMAWRWGSSGYSGGCTQSHVSNQTPSDSRGTDKCTLLGGGVIGGCGSADTVYVVTDLEDDKEGDFCYGYQSESFPKPSGPLL